MVIVYTRDELIGLCSQDVIPARATRKAIFSHHLWQPAHERKQNWWKTRRTTAGRTTTTTTTADNDGASAPTARQRPRRSPGKSAARFGLLNAQSVGNSSTAIATTVDEGHYDVFLLTETWHTSHEDVALRCCVPAGYTCLDVARPTTDPDKQNHGGVAAVISDALDYRQLPAPFNPTTFESIAFTVGSPDSTVAVLLIYRPGSSAVTDAFFTELSTYLEVFALYKCQILVAGDFNIHVESAGDADAARLRDLLQSFDCVQQVPLIPTHREGGTLDLVVTKSEQVLTEMTVDPPCIISDHSVISWCFPLSIKPRIVINREVRAWSKVNQDSFCAAVLESELCSVDHHAVTADDYFELYDSVLTRLADRFAPVKRVTIRRQRLALWMDKECRQLRRKSRMLERRYRRTRLADDRRAWVDHVTRSIGRRSASTGQREFADRLSSHGNSGALSTR